MAQDSLAVERERLARDGGGHERVAIPITANPRADTQDAQVFGRALAIGLVVRGVELLPDGTPRLAIFMESDAIALFSEDSIREFIARGFPRERIFKITDGVSLDVFHPTEAPIDRIEGTPLRVLFSGRLVPLKGLMDLLAVWPQVCTLLAADGRRAELHICGEGPQQAEIEATMRDLFKPVE